MNFDQAMQQLLRFEGGYTNNPADHGGETNYGITKATALAFGYTAPMCDMPQSFAEHIYQKQYWDACRCDDLPEPIRYDVFDAAVNSGVAQSIKWLQRAVGVADDGIIGRVTLAACNDTAHINSKFNGQRLMFMTALPSWSTFGKGWARRIADNLMRGVA
jgi:lysozyme family protein